MFVATNRHHGHINIQKITLQPTRKKEHMESVDDLKTIPFQFTMTKLTITFVGSNFLT